MHRDLQIPMRCLQKQATANERESQTSAQSSFKNVLENTSCDERERLALLNTTGVEGSIDDSVKPVAKWSPDSPESWMETGLSYLRRRWRALSLRTKECIVSVSNR